MKTVEELKKEQYEAKAKLHDLIEMVNSEEFYKLSAAEKGLINQERTGLELYLSSLTKRVYGNPQEVDTNNMVWLSLLYGMFNWNSATSSVNSVDYLKEKLDKKDEEIYAFPEHAV